MSRTGAWSLFSVRLWLWAALLSLLAVAIIWYPFGFTLGGLVEEWDLFYKFASRGAFWNFFPGQPIRTGFVARPLTPLPFFLAWLIDRHSFFGFHVILAIACGLKVFFGTLIGRFLFRDLALASIVGLLFLVLPADTAQISLRVAHIDFAVSLIVGGSTLGLVALLATNRLLSTLLAVLAVTFAVVGTFVYEPVAVLYALLPSVLVVRFGVAGAIRFFSDHIRISLVLLLGPLINAAYLVYALGLLGSRYEVELLNAGSFGLRSLFGNATFIVDPLYRALFAGWWDAAAILVVQTAHLAYPFFVFVMIAVILLLASLAVVSRRDPLPRAGRGLWLGILLIVLSYLPVMIFPGHTAVSQRTFLTIVPGTVIAIASLLATIRRRILGLAMGASLVSLGFVAQLYQYDRFARLYTLTWPYLVHIAESSDQQKHVHLVFDDAGLGGHIQGLYFGKVALAPPFLRNVFRERYFMCERWPPSRYINSYYCTLDSGVWKVTGRGLDNNVYSFAESEVDQIELSFDDGQQGGGRNLQLHNTRLFHNDDSMFYPDRDVSDTYTCLADAQWGYSTFCPGAGWSDGSVQRKWFRDTKYFLPIATETSLLFRLNPRSGSDYLLKLQLTEGAPSETMHDIRLAVNGELVSPTWPSATVLEARVPWQLLHDGNNEIKFSNMIPNGADHGFKVSRIDLAPIGNTLRIVGQTRPLSGNLQR
jgi:hypothetical protein